MNWCISGAELGAKILGMTLEPSMPAPAFDVSMPVVYFYFIGWAFHDVEVTE